MKAFDSGVIVVSGFALVLNAAAISYECGAVGKKCNDSVAPVGALFISGTGSSATTMSTVDSYAPIRFVPNTIMDAREHAGGAGYTSEVTLSLSGTSAPWGAQS